MRPAYDHAGWNTFDLTEAKLHFAAPANQPDAEPRLIACIPTKWEPIGEHMTIATSAGRMRARQYRVLEWCEYELPDGVLASVSVKPKVKSGE